MLNPVDRVDEGVFALTAVRKAPFIPLVPNPSARVEVHPHVSQIARRGESRLAIQQSAERRAALRYIPADDGLVVACAAH